MDCDEAFKWLSRLKKTYQLVKEYPAVNGRVIYVFNK